MALAANYRVKVDLSEFYSDAQKLSYIYIDSATMTNVLHLQTKIKRMFFINRPFYLAVNGVFLPISEDIRIIKDDEVVFVRADPERPAPPLQCEVTVMSTPQEKFSADKDLKIIEPSGTDETDDEVQVFHESKHNLSTNDVQLLDGSTSGPKKRKRVRRRKPKKEQQDSYLLTLTKNPLHNGFATNNQLTKVDDLDTKPSHKHLKFNWDESEETENKLNGPLTPINHSAKPVVRSTEVTSLKTLLNLRNCPRPVSFSPQKPSQKNSETSFNGNETLLVAKGVVEPMESSPATNKSAICTLPGDTDYSKLNFDEYEISTEKFLVNDVIAFKILTLGADYTPFLSDFIVARVDEILRDNYVCTILFGSEQLKDPDGKFAIQIDEWSSGNKNEDSVVMLNTAHLDQTRLIHRPSA